MTTYTILDGMGDLVARGLSLEDAADAIMTHDGREWEIRKDKRGWFFVRARRGASYSWQEMTIQSFEPKIAAARQDIWREIVDSDLGRGHCEAMTDAAYDRMAAQALEDND